VNLPPSPLKNKTLTGLNTYQHLWLLLVIVAFGIVLRLYNLGSLGLTENEDYVANAVRSILQTGLPIYPSGVLYPRALPFTYLTSISVHLFGFEDFSLRIPGTVFSVLSIVVGYLLTARFFGVRVALIAAFLFAFSDWEILLGRTARMYGTLSFFLLLSIWLLDKAVLEGGKFLKSLTIISLVVTCFIHKLAIMLLPFILFYYLFRKPRGQNMKFLALCIFATIFAYVSNSLIERHYYSQAFAIEKTLIANQKAKAAALTTETTEIKHEKKSINLLDKILQSTPATLLAEKHLHVFIEAKKQHPIMVLILIFGFSASLLFYSVKNFRNTDSRLYALALLLILIPLCLQQITLSLLVTLTYLVLSKKLEPETYAHRTKILLSFSGISVILWIFLGAISLQDSVTENIYTTASMLISFPTCFFSLYYNYYPFLSICAFVAAGIALKNYLANGQLDEIGFIALLFTGTMLLMGLHPLALSNPYPRYVAYLNPYFLILVAFSINIAITKISQLQQKKIMLVTVSILGAILILRETAYSAWYMVNTNYGDNDIPAAVAGNVRSFYPDQKTTAVFVKQHASDKDIIIAMDTLAFYVYYPRMNFQLRATGGTDAERWLGQRTLFTDLELRDVLTTHRENNIWIVLEGKMLKQYNNNPQWTRILDLIKTQAGLPRYLGRDQLSSVYMIPAQIKDTP